jgi:hypothetical protein
MKCGDSRKEASEVSPFVFALEATSQPRGVRLEQPPALNPKRGVET